MALRRADELYDRYFGPWYMPERPQLHPGTRPDIEEVLLEPGQHIGVLQPLDPEQRQMPREKVQGMLGAFLQDGERLLKQKPPLTRDWIAAIDTWATKENVGAILAKSEPMNFSNPYLILCCEFGAGVGDVICQARPTAQWIYDWPYWDSAVFDLNRKIRFPVFHWVVKRMTELGSAESLADKVDAALAFLDEPAAADPDIVTSDPPESES